MKKWRDLWVDQGKFKIHKDSGYKIYRPAVLVVTVLLMVYLSFSMYWAVTHERYHLSCDVPGGCDNPLNGLECSKYGAPDTLCSTDWLPEGFSSGYEAPSFFKDAPTYSIILLVGLVVFNNIAYNMREEQHGK